MRGLVKMVFFLGSAVDKLWVGVIGVVEVWRGGEVVQVRVDGLVMVVWTIINDIMMWRSLVRDDLSQFTS